MSFKRLKPAQEYTMALRFPQRPGMLSFQHLATGEQYNRAPQTVMMPQMTSHTMRKLMMVRVGSVLKMRCAWQVMESLYSICVKL